MQVSSTGATPPVETKVIKIDPENFADAQLSYPVELIKRGEVVAFPTETVYGLGANALSASAVSKIFSAKNRPMDNPLIVHISDMEMLKPLVTEIPAMLEPLLKDLWPGALTVLLKRTSVIPDETAAGLPTVGIRMPSHPITRKLISLSGCPIAAPSANLSGRPSPTAASHVIHDMTGRVLCIVDGGRSHYGVESTVIDIYSNPPMILRPGGITLEQLRKYIPNIQVYAKNSNTEMEQKPPTPGLKYRHYSPDARVILFEGTNLRKMADEMHRTIDELLHEQKKIGVIHSHGSAFDPLPPQHSHHSNTSSATNSTRYKNVIVQRIGESQTALEVAQGLFAALRCLDDEHKCQVILVEGIEETHEGLAVMNRIRKAASSIIHC